MREINRIVVHCSATPPSMDIGVVEIRDWHVNDNGWRDVGYHFVIRRNGRVEPGRPVEQTGAHVQGYNYDSIGVCLIGGVGENGKPDSNFTFAQYESLKGVLTKLLGVFGEHVTVQGHRDLDSGKACPSMDAGALL